MQRQLEVTWRYTALPREEKLAENKKPALSYPDLPEKLVEKIVEKLSPKDIVSFSSTCRALNKYSIYRYREKEINAYTIVEKIKINIKKIKEINSQVLQNIFSTSKITPQVNSNMFVQLPESKLQTALLNETKYLPSMRDIKQRIHKEVKENDIILSRNNKSSCLCCTASTCGCAAVGGGVGLVSGVAAIPTSCPIVGCACCVLGASCSLIQILSFGFSCGFCCCCFGEIDRGCAYYSAEWACGLCRWSPNLCSCPDFLGPLSCGGCAYNTPLFTWAAGIGGAIGCCLGAVGGIGLSQYANHGLHEESKALRTFNSTLIDLSNQLTQLKAFIQFSSEYKKNAKEEITKAEIEIMQSLIEECVVQSGMTRVVSL